MVPAEVVKRQPKKTPNSVLVQQQKEQEAKRQEELRQLLRERANKKKEGGAQRSRDTRDRKGQAQGAATEPLAVALPRSIRIPEPGPLRWKERRREETLRPEPLADQGEGENAERGCGGGAAAGGAAGSDGSAAGQAQR